MILPVQVELRHKQEVQNDERGVHEQCEQSHEHRESRTAYNAEDELRAQDSVFDSQPII